MTAPDSAPPDADRPLAELTDLELEQHTTNSVFRAWQRSSNIHFAQSRADHVLCSFAFVCGWICALGLAPLLDVRLAWLLAFALAVYLGAMALGRIMRTRKLIDELRGRGTDSFIAIETEKTLRSSERRAARRPVH
jgi:hypothetical protein